MNHDVPQPTTATRVPCAGRSECSRVIDAARAHVSGWEASSAAMCAAGVAEGLCGSLTFGAPGGVGGPHATAHGGMTNQ